MNEPHYKGGQKAIDDFVRKNLKYPPNALENKIEGDVEIKYDINHKGKVISTEVLGGIGYGCDEEASRVVSINRFEVNVPKGNNAVFHRKIKIHFRLPKAKLNYTYQVKKKGNKEPEKKGQAYSYSIKIEKKT